MDSKEDHDLKSGSENDSDAETVDYSKSKPDGCIENNLKNFYFKPKPDEAETDDDNMSTASSHDCASHKSSSSDSSSDEETASDEETDERGNKIYKEVDLEIAQFIVEMRLALNTQHDVNFSAVNYLKVFYKKFKAFKASNLYSVLREEMADFKNTHRFASSSETLENALEVRRIFIQNLFNQIEDVNAGGSESDN
tara:strand:+ start:331 stop:918 length:588 start_codon:yes stop_codon:yes gene_type:complete